MITKDDINHKNDGIQIFTIFSFTVYVRRKKPNNLASVFPFPKNQPEAPILCVVLLIRDLEKTIL